MTTLTLCRGLPGSGKTTWATSDFTEGVPISRDELRKEFYPERGQDYYGHDDLKTREQYITWVQYERIRALLQVGISVVVHDTNLVARRCREFMRIAEDAGATFVEKRFEVLVDACIARQAYRPEDERVPADPWGATDAPLPPF
jgi:predicted kinase